MLREPILPRPHQNITSLYLLNIHHIERHVKCT